MNATFALIEDDSNYRNFVVDLLTGAGCSCVGAFADAKSALEVLHAIKPKVLLVDLHLAEGNGIQCVRQLKQQPSDCEIVMLTVEDRPQFVFEAIEAGAIGYVVKSAAAEHIVSAVMEAARGGAPMTSHIARSVIQRFREMRSVEKPLAVDLTQAEEEVIRLLARGFRNKEVAQEKGLSEHTVRTHLRNIYRKLHVNSRRAAIRKAGLG